MNDLEREIARSCFSYYDGCICRLAKGHTSLHECPSDVHPHREWTDEESDASEKRLAAEIKATLAKLDSK